jgi:hypothetical protein
VKAGAVSSEWWRTSHLGRECQRLSRGRLSQQRASVRCRAARMKPYAMRLERIDAKAVVVWIYIGKGRLKLEGPESCEVFLTSERTNHGGAKLETGRKARTAITGSDPSVENLLCTPDQRLRFDWECGCCQHRFLIHLPLYEALGVGCSTDR